MKKNSNVGVIIANTEGVFLGYSEKEGFFRSKESFFSLKAQESLDKNTIWFSNLPLKEIKVQNIKSSSYLDVEIEDILSYLGYSMNQKTIKMVMRKYHDFILMFINNLLVQFKDTNLENSNNSVLVKRKAMREEIILKSKTYKEALLLIGKTLSSRLSVEVNKNNKIENQFVKEIYDIKRYHETNNKNNLINDIIVNKLKKEERTVINKTRSFEYKLLTLNEKSLLQLPELTFFSQDNYEIVDLEQRLKERKDYKKVIAEDNYLFFHVKIRTTELVHDSSNKVSFKILGKLDNKEAIMSMEEYLHYCSSNFLKVKLLKGYRLKESVKKNWYSLSSKLDLVEEYKHNQDIVKYNNTIKQIKEIKENIGFHFSFDSSLFSWTLTEEQRLNKLQNHIHTFNYLQIILLNDNFLLNEWIKSQLLCQNIKLVENFLKLGITVSSYDYKSITLNIDVEEKEEVRKILERINVAYPASLL